MTKEQAHDDDAEKPILDDGLRALRVGEMCELLHVSRSAGYELVRTGAIKSVRLGGMIRVPIAALREVLQRSAAGDPL